MGNCVETRPKDSFGLEPPVGTSLTYSESEDLSDLFDIEPGNYEEWMFNVLYKKNNKKYMIKRVTDVLSGRREFRMYKKLRDVDCILRSRSLLILKREAYMIFDPMVLTLNRAIKVMKLEEAHKIEVVYRLLSACRHFHRRGLVHQDLRPSCIFLNENFRITIVDLNWMADLNSPLEEDQQIPASYSITRHYLPPEVLCGSTKISPAADLWAVGCILAEVILGVRLFSGTSNVEHLTKIVKLLGYPSEEDIKAMDAPYTKILLRETNLGENMKSSLSRKFCSLNQEAQKLLAGLLDYNPNRRWSADRALESQWFDLRVMDSSPRSTHASTVDSDSNGDAESKDKES